MKNIVKEIMDLIEENCEKNNCERNTKAEQQMAIDTVAQIVAQVYLKHHIIPKITETGTKIAKVL